MLSNKLKLLTRKSEKKNSIKLDGISAKSVGHRVPKSGGLFAVAHIAPLTGYMLVTRSAEHRVHRVAHFVEEIFGLVRREARRIDERFGARAARRVGEARERER